ncbi:MAG: formylmethanofuran dehydrogenase [Clostridia bacterium]|nr:formylmethanofuran dehydrogenase [Clostridia bacterium]
MENESQLWEKCINFHGHSCGGLAIGFKAAQLAKNLLKISFSEDEDIVCVTENDACGVDAVQVVLGCSVGKGNLIFRNRGKQAFSFFNRKTGEAVRLVLKDLPEIEREKKKEYILQSNGSDIFEIKKPSYPLPEKARIFSSVVCEECGEKAAEPMIRLKDGKKVCLDCYKPYTRGFEVSS